MASKIKKGFKNLREEEHTDKLPVHDAPFTGVQLPTKFERPRKEGTEGTPSEALPVHPSDAGVELPNSFAGIGARAVKPELDGQKIANARGLAEDEDEDEDKKEVKEEEEDDEKEKKDVKESDDKDEDDKEDVKEGEDKDLEDELKEEEDEEDKKKEDTEVKEHVKALLHGESTLSEEFKNKATLIFKTAVKSKVDASRKKIAKLAEGKIEKRVKKLSEGLVDKIDKYLDYVVEEWMKENKLAVEAGLRTEITEKFISGLKGLFESNYIDIPDSKIDLLAESNKKVEKLETELNSALNKNVELNKKLHLKERVEAIESASKGLTDTQKDKFKSLVENVSFENSNDFSKKLQVIKESYFPKSTAKGADVSQTTLVEEGGLDKPKNEGPADAIDLVFNAISSSVKK